ncbi:hypothetical protein BC833DRAFT_570025 [Globomyces pollinis-pini]|nr:hypothetical protein BC833DRAFT_570025 [Globomyces pollinis-pini]
MDQIPTELILYIFEYLPCESLLRMRRVSRTMYNLSLAIPLPIEVVAVLGYQDFNMEISKTSQQIHIKNQPYTHWLYVNLSFESNELTMENILDCCTEYVAQRTTQKVQLNFNTLVNNTRNNTLKEYEHVRTGFQGIGHLVVSNPAQSCLLQMPSTVKSLSLVSVHTELSIGTLKNTERLTLQSDGRFYDQEGIFSWRAFEGLRNHLTLKHLILDGPWLEMMIEYSFGVLEIIKSIKGLTTLLIDLDQEKHGAQTIYSLFNSLEHLESFGRLGRVDRSFWRLFSKQKCVKIKSIQLGNIKVPIAHRLSPNLKFLPDLAFGVVWAFPNIETVSINIGFQGGLDTDILLDIAKQLKDGLPGSENKSKLKRLEMFQVSDVDLLRAFQWNYVALTYGGGEPISIYVTDDAVIGGNTGRCARTFGILGSA